MPAVALGIGAVAATIGGASIFKRNRNEGYDVKTSILRTIPEAVAAFAGAALTGGLLHSAANTGMSDVITAETHVDTPSTVEPAPAVEPAPTVETAPTVEPAPAADTASGTDTDADTGAATDTGDTGSGSTQPLEEPAVPR